MYHGEAAVLDLLQLQLLEVALGEAWAANGEHAASAQPLQQCALLKRSEQRTLHAVSAT